MTGIASNITVINRKVLLVGRSAAAVDALRQLQAYAAFGIAVFSDRVASDLLDVAGTRLVHRLPSTVEIEGAAMLMIADLPPDLAAPLLAVARAAGVPVEQHSTAARVAPRTTPEAPGTWSEPCLIYAF